MSSETQMVYLVCKMPSKKVDEFSFHMSILHACLSPVTIKLSLSVCTSIYTEKRFKNKVYVYIKVKL